MLFFNYINTILHHKSLIKFTTHDTLLDVFDDKSGSELNPSLNSGSSLLSTINTLMKNKILHI